jgi:uncharacterized membrane protein (DUF2068 family)
MNERRNFLVRRFGLKGVAVFEAIKGLGALVGGAWVLSLVHGHKDLMKVAGHMLSFMHIGPERHFYYRVLREAEKMTPGTLWVIVVGILIYATVRFVEAAGLWLEKEWAEWFALLTGAMYLPLELYAIVRHSTWFKWGILCLNILVLLYLGWLLQDSWRRRRHKDQPVTAGA